MAQFQRSSADAPGGAGRPGPSPPLAAPGPTDDPDGLGLVAIGGDLGPGSLLEAYRRGLFPMNLPDGRRGWWSPPERGVFLPGSLQVSRSLRKATARFETRVDAAFEAVVRACAAQPRPHAWIDEEIVAAYTTLHRLGWAHSVEAWRDGELVGGLYGLAIGGLFAGESMFHHVDDASKVALVALFGLLDDDPATLVDCQWLNPHLASLGAVAVSRDEYLARQGRALQRPVPARLLERAAADAGDGAER